MIANNINEICKKIEMHLHFDKNTKIIIEDCVGNNLAIKDQLTYDDFTVLVVPLDRSDIHNSTKKKLDDFCWNYIQNHIQQK